jgi:hypothetical protein
LELPRNPLRCLTGYAKKHGSPHEAAGRNAGIDEVQKIPAIRPSRAACATELRFPFIVAAPR